MSNFVDDGTGLPSFVNANPPSGAPGELSADALNAMVQAEYDLRAKALEQESRIVAVQGSIGSLSAEVAPVPALVEQTNAISSDVSRQGELLASVQSAVTDHTQQISNLQGGFTSHAGVIAGLQDSSSTQNTQINNLTQSSYDQGLRIGAIESQFAGHAFVYGTEAPLDGTWGQGDIVWNSAPVAGGTPGWVCVSSGTPGTWKAMASLAG